MRIKSVMRIISVCVILVLMIPVPGFSISVKDEKEISKEFANAVRKRFRLVKDPLVVDYINKLGNRIVSVLPIQPFQYSFNVIIATEYNAFAGPGAQIFVNSGLVAALEREEELAGILGHEITHAACRHISERIETSKKIQLGTLAGIVAGLLIGASGGSGGADAATALTMGSMAAGQTASLAYSRDHEMQADQIGLKYLNKAGYSGRGLYTSMQKIRSKSWYGSDLVPTYLMTHPAPEERMLYLQSWMDDHKDDIKTPVVPNVYEYTRFRFTIMGKYSDEDIAMSQFEDMFEDDPDDPLVNYGYALVLTRKELKKQAISHLKRAIRKKPLDPYLLSELGRVYFLDGQYRKSFQVLEGIHREGSFDTEIQSMLGQSRMELGDNLDASVIFEQVIADDPEYVPAYYHLGECLGKLKKLGPAHYNLGIYYEKTGDFRNARFHLRKAASLIKDQEKLDIIDGMLKGLGKKKKK